MALSLFCVLAFVACNGERTTWNKVGDGTLLSLYMIYSSKQIVSPSAQTDNSFPDIYFALGANIDLKNKEWSPIGGEEFPFSGVFDGRGYVISNFKAASDCRYAVLFYTGTFGWDGDVWDFSGTNFEDGVYPNLK